jgi:hypothetical protein
MHATKNGQAKSGRLPPVSKGANGSLDRGADGRFAVGNRGGPGNPFVRRLATLRKAVTDAVDEGRLRRIMRKLASMAEAGDLHAAEIVLAYAVGKPTAAVDPDAVDRLELEALLSGPRVDEVALTLLGRATAGDALEMIRGALNEEGRVELLRAGLLALLNKRGDHSGQPRTYDAGPSK